MQILVLGMHRSGTSAVIRLLNMMGAYLGPPGSVKGANPENPKGFWENDALVELNKSVLGAQRCLWNRLSSFDADKLTGDQLGTLRRRARDFLIGLDASRPWAVKDPRMCLLLPFWRPLLEVPVCVLVNRHVLEVARSLRTRNDIPLHVGIAMWELHTREVLRGTVGLPRVLVQYAHLIQDPVGVTRHLLEQLEGLGVRKLSRPSDEEIRAFVDPALHRERATPDESADLLTPPQRALSDAMTDGSALEMGDVPPLSQVAVEVLRTYDTTLHARTEIEHLEGVVVARERELADLRRAAERAAANAREAGGQGPSTDPIALKAVVDGIEDLSERVRMLEQTLARADERISRIGARLEESPAPMKPPEPAA